MRKPGKDRKFACCKSKSWRATAIGLIGPRIRFDGKRKPIIGFTLRTICWQTVRVSAESANWIQPDESPG